MALLNPVPNFKFQVYLFDSPGDTTKDDVFGSFSWKSAVGAGVGIGMNALFGGFSDVSGLSAQIEVEEYREGGRNEGALKLLKWGKYPNIVLKRGVTFNTDIWDWYYQVLYGTKSPMRKSGIVILNDRGGVSPTPGPINVPVMDALPVAVWFFKNGLPEKLEGPGLSARGNEIAVETLEISHEGLMRLGPGMIPGIGETLTSVGL